MAGARNIIIMAVAGLVAGAGGGVAVTKLLPAPAAKEAHPAPVEAGDGAFATLGAILVPLIHADGQFTTYVRIEAQLEVPADDLEAVKAKLPLVIHAVNVRAYGKPLAAGPDGRLPNAAAFRAIVSEEAGKVLGKGVVRSVALTSLAPA